jgi:hypothetical protein
MALSMVNGLSRWFRPGGKLSVEEVIEQYLDILLGGLAEPAQKR